MAIGVNTFTLFIPNSEVKICYSLPISYVLSIYGDFYCVTIDSAKVTFP